MWLPDVTGALGLLFARRGRVIGLNVRNLAATQARPHSSCLGCRASRGSELSQSALSLDLALLQVKVLGTAFDPEATTELALAIYQVEHRWPTGVGDDRTGA